MSLRGASVATKQSPRQWETAHLHLRQVQVSERALEAQLKSAEEEMGRLVAGVLAQIGGQDGE
jgi:hypothetical protein